MTAAIIGILGLLASSMRATALKLLRLSIGVLCGTLYSKAAYDTGYAVARQAGGLGRFRLPKTIHRIGRII
jgi:hypothetical protein